MATKKIGYMHGIISSVRETASASGKPMYVVTLEDGNYFSSSTSMFPVIPEPGLFAVHYREEDKWGLDDDGTLRMARRGPQIIGIMSAEEGKAILASKK